MYIKSKLIVVEFNWYSSRCPFYLLFQIFKVSYAGRIKIDTKMPFLILIIFIENKKTFIFIEKKQYRLAFFSSFEN